MKAITYDAYGAPLQVTEQPTPKVGPGSILIRVKAAGVNPVDWKVMGGYLDSFMDIEFPAIPGWDAAGVVEAVGIDTPEFSVGDEVITYGRKNWVHGGSFAELMAVPADIAATKPTNMSWEEAAGLPLVGLTSYQTLKRMNLAQGETLLIHGGAGGVGAAGIQIAVSMGARVIATASKPNHDYLRSLGAEPVEYGDQLVGQVRSLAPEGVDLVADFVGGVLEQTLAVLRKGGRHASIDDGSVLDHGGPWLWARPSGADLQALADMVNDGTLSIRVGHTFPLEEAAQAFELSQGGHPQGKIVLKVAE